MSAIVAYIDGGARGNPGPAGYGVRIEDDLGTVIDEFHGFIGSATNNIAEYNALLAALRYAREHGHRKVRIKSDSELLVKQMKGEYRVKNAGLQPLYQQAHALAQALDRVVYEHVRREKNKDADRLSNLAMDEGTGPPEAASRGDSLHAMKSSRMPEAEVSLRLAFWLLHSGATAGPIDVAIDGAQVQTAGTLHFDIHAFLADAGWNKAEKTPSWQCDWSSPTAATPIRIHSNPGNGDVVARLRSGRLLRAECKKGPLKPTASSPEYPLLREALGQLITIDEVGDKDLLVVAVPHSQKFEELARRWRQAPLVRRLGIQIATVTSDGNVLGLDLGT